MFHFVDVVIGKSEKLRENSPREVIKTSITKSQPRVKGYPFSEFHFMVIPYLTFIHFLEKSSPFGKLVAYPYITRQPTVSIFRVYLWNDTHTHTYAS